MTCFVEQCFRQRVHHHPGGNRILSKWESDKKAYKERTALTVFDFQHFSMHDESHSVKILNYIELLLGRDRIERDLSLGDLWLLLECAYFHDIGMTLTKEERTKLWTKDREFRKYITERLQDDDLGADRDLFEAAHYYKYIDDLLNGKRLPEILDEEIAPQADWPETLNDKVRLLMTDYIRRHHAERCRNALNQIVGKDSEFMEGPVEKRLYELVALVSAQHTQEFNKIFEDLLYEENAFGNEYVHPQFIAALLRIGDVLDMDNNRFNVRVLDHVGTLPLSSEIHLKKHKALTNYNVTPEGIVAVARSAEFDVSKAVRDWFNWIENEVRDLKYNWNNIAPNKLRRCRLRYCDLKVYLNKNEFTSRNTDRFSFDSRKMQKLLIGDSIYSCRLDCIREYIQNAMDASKVKLWGLLNQENVEYLFRDGIHQRPWSETLPCDLKEDVFLQFPIHIELSLHRATQRGENDHIQISIRDHGIGMDSACAKDITTIGRGWRNRQEYLDVFEHAPKWLRPTGGFGIGIQSAFMLTDRVTYSTRSEIESYGHVIRLVSPSKGGSVSDEIQNGLSQGTEVCFDIDVFKFLDPTELGLSKFVQQRVRGKMQNSLAAMFSDTYLLELAGAICQAYIEEQVPNSLFPIRFGFQGYTPTLLPSPCYYEYEIDSKSNEAVGKTPLKMYPFQNASATISDGDSKAFENYAYCIVLSENIPDHDDRAQRIILWDRVHMDCVAFTFPDKPLDRDIGPAVSISFKDILVPEPERNIVIPNVSYSFNLLGQSAGETLQVSRAKLNRDFGDTFRNRLAKHLYVALMLLFPNYLEQVKSGNTTIRDDYKRMLFALFSQNILQDDLPEIINRLRLQDYAGVPFLDNVYCLKKEVSKIGEDHYQISAVSGLNAINAFLEIFSKYDQSKNFVFYALSTAKQTDPTAKTDPEYINELLKTDCGSPSYIFTSDWNWCFSSFWISDHTKLEQTRIPIAVELEGVLPGILEATYDIIRYSIEQKPSKPVDEDTYHSRVILNDEDLRQRYSMLRVNAVPFPKVTSSIRYAHIVPGNEFLDKLESVGAHNAEMTTDAIKQALSADADAMTDFTRLLRWVFTHQYHETSEDTRKYQEIEQAYLDWILELLKQKRSS